MRASPRAFALLMAVAPGAGFGRDRVQATNSETFSGFTNLADCQGALGPAVWVPTEPGMGGGPKLLSGSQFNRGAGNTSRCELVQGEFQIVVYPKDNRAGTAGQVGHQR